MLPFEELVGGWALFLLVVEDPDELLTDFKLEVVVSCGDVGTSGGVTGRETGVIGCDSEPTSDVLCNNVGVCVNEDLRSSSLSASVGNCNNNYRNSIINVYNRMLCK